MSKFTRHGCFILTNLHLKSLKLIYLKKTLITIGMSWPERLANVPNERWHKNLNLGRMKCRVIQFVKEFIYTVCFFSEWVGLRLAYNVLYNNNFSFGFLLSCTLSLRKEYYFCASFLSCAK